MKTLKQKTLIWWGLGGVVFTIWPKRKCTRVGCIFLFLASFRFSIFPFKLGQQADLLNVRTGKTNKHVGYNSVCRHIWHTHLADVSDVVFRYGGGEKGGGVRAGGGGVGFY